MGYIVILWIYITVAEFLLYQVRNSYPSFFPSTLFKRRLFQHVPHVTQRSLGQMKAAIVTTSRFARLWKLPLSSERL